MKTIFGAGINVGAQKASSADVHIQHSAFNSSVSLELCQQKCFCSQDAFT